MWGRTCSSKDAVPEKGENASYEPTLERVGRKSVSRAGLGKCALEKWCQRVFAIRLDSGKSGAEACF
jgi:hypothetical protein